MGLLHILRTISGHPLNKHQKLRSILRFVKFNIGSRLVKYPVVYPFTEKCQLFISRGMTGASGNLYCGLHEYYDMSFLLHFLRPEDTFADIGANVGSFTVLASAHIGAFSISIEPVEKTFNLLNKNIRLNNIQDRTTPINIALGSSGGELLFTNDLDTINHVANEGESGTVTKVIVDTMDNVFNNRIPVLMKIDVEGFETEVIKGGSETVAHPNLKAIIIELNGLGKRYGFDEVAVHEKLLENKFAPYIYNPEKRILNPCDSFGKENTIYIRDLDFVNQRIQSASKFRIFDKWI